MPLHTPLGGSWPGTLWVMAESLQRIVCGRALAGWNAAPTRFAWGGKRQARRADTRRAAVARARRIGGSAAVEADAQSNAA